MTRPAGRRESSDKENTPGEQELVRSHGAIIRVTFENFLTYDKVSFKPGPHLNVVIGPNGTGKSTILCGICLAVGGDTKILGRSTEIRDFVKHGKQEGWVEVELWDAKRKAVRKFRLRIRRAGSPMAQYFIDGKLETKKAVLAEVATYNIQVDNPCVFLAQDKVASFAQQSAPEKLRNTERAGPVELLRLHDDMRDMEEGGTYEEELRRNEGKLAAARRDKEKLKPRRDHYMEMEGRRTRLQLLRKRKIFLDYEASAAAWHKAQDEVSQAEEHLRSTRGRANPLDKQIDAARAEQRKLADETEKHRRMAESSKAYIEENLCNRSLGEQISNANADWTKLREEAGRWDETRKELEASCEDMKRIYENEQQKVANHIDPEFEQNRAKIPEDTKRLETEKRQLDADEDRLMKAKNAFERKRNDADELLQRKLNHLCHQNQGIGQAWRYYLEHKAEFRYDVLVPHLHVHVRNPNHLKYLNNSVGTRDASVFIFGCKEDENLLMAGNNPFRINSSIIDGDLLEQYRERKTLSDEVKQLGFSQLISECIEAPDRLYAYLCSVSGLDKIPIGNRQVDERCEEIGRQLYYGPHPYKVFLTENTRVAVTGSRYNTQQIYVNRSQLHPQGPFHQEHAQRVWGSAEDFAREEAELRREIGAYKERQTAYRERRQAHDVKASTFRQQEREYNQRKGQVDGMRLRWERSKAKLERHTTQRPNLEEAQLAFEETKKNILAEAMLQSERLVDRFQRVREQLVNVALGKLEIKRLENLARRLRHEKEERGVELDNLGAQLQAKKRQAEERRIDSKHSKELLIEAVKGRPSDGPELTSAEKNYLKGLIQEFQTNNIPDDMADVQQQIEDESAQVQAGGQDGLGSKRDVDEYDDVERAEKRLEHLVNELKSKKDNWRGSMDEKLQQWLEPLKELIVKIDAEYSRLFSKLGYEGRVALSIPEDKYKVNEYGIEIRVKFRAESKLATLTSRVQSGGERSVSTMLYLMALQNICHVPFRCVDEINQGMDETNERKVFNMMTQLLSERESNIAKTQYFLLTPKLLRGLEYTDQVAVHIVHNGPAMENVESWDPQKFLRRAAMAGGSGTS